jgi:predicted enzyme related to lactoylglutathione lyase
MISFISKITLYVNNQTEAKKFWTEKIGFMVTTENTMGSMTWLEVAPKDYPLTSFVLYDKNLMKSQNPLIDTSHPSIILSTKDIEDTFNELKNNGVQVGEIQSFPYGKMFSFMDQDNNSYLVRQNNLSH